MKDNMSRDSMGEGNAIQVPTPCGSNHTGSKNNQKNLLKEIVVYLWSSLIICLILIAVLIAIPFFIVEVPLIFLIEKMSLVDDKDRWNLI